MVLDDISAPHDGVWGNGDIPHTFNFTVNDGDEVVIDYTAGSYASENSYMYYNNIGMDFYTSPAPPEDV
ncbi:MAG: hypothetical protein U9N34_05475 [Candidatus Cloacimonadota bacterium]|nr:hypothetical protein [Candidatus Cloacimonadota bacterium]